MRGPHRRALARSRGEVRTKTTVGQYSPVQLEQARLVSSLLYGTRAMLDLNLPAFENQKYTAYDRFHGNGQYGKIPTKKEPITTLGFTSRLPCHIIMASITASVDIFAYLWSMHASIFWIFLLMCQSFLDCGTYCSFLRRALFLIGSPSAI